MGTTTIREFLKFPQRNSNIRSEFPGITIMEDTIMLNIPNDIMKQFSILSSRLSPENLYCDGEISKTQAMKRYREIMREWRVLEKIVGRKVSEDEVINFMLATYRK